MKITSILLGLFFFCSPTNQSKNENSDNLIQIAILLDTSSSMNGLIEQTKSQLWSITNEIAKAKKNSNDVLIEFALYEYGNDNIPSYQKHVRQVAAFTEDMDLISNHLFALKTDGGQEYCGQVIHNSITELNWNPDAGLKAIYIAGNEGFNQGEYPYKIACQEAKDDDIVINTIFCGNYETGFSLEWNNGASLSRGAYNNINHNAVTLYIETPYDSEINALNKKLNETYISYSTRNQHFKLNQSTQDENANLYGRANYTKRSIFKIQSNYKNSRWDVIDANDAGTDIYLYNDQLPEFLQSKSKEALLSKIEKLKSQREAIKADIITLSLKRDTYIQNSKNEKYIENPFEEAILQSLRIQLLGAGFSVG